MFHASVTCVSITLHTLTLKTVAETFYKWEQNCCKGNLFSVKENWTYNEINLITKNNPVEKINRI